MPRDGSGVYTTAPGTDGVAGQTIESLKYNANVHDVEQDLNTPRPIVAGGTGAITAHDALINLHGEESLQGPVTNYDTFSFVSGSFYSNPGATAAPDGANYFVGICVTTGALTTLEARAMSAGGGAPKDKYVRVKDGAASAWSAWTGETVRPPTAPTDPANKAYVDAGDAAANAAAAAAQGTANAANAAAATAQGTANTAQTAASNANTNANNRLLRTTDTFTGALTVTGDIVSGTLVIAGNGALYSRSNSNPTLFLQDANGAARSAIFYNRGSNSLDMLGPATTSVSIAANGKVQVSNGIQSKAGFSGGYGTVCYNLNWNGSKFVLYADDINLGVVPLMTDITALEDKLKAALARIEALERQLVPA